MAFDFEGSALSYLLIRANASSRIGSGHVMRCLALAQGWQRQGGRACFILSERIEGLANRIVGSGFDVCYLPTGVDLGDVADSDFTIAQAKRLSASWIVIDGYDFDGDYQTRIKQASFKLLFVDDFGHCDSYSADLVLNQNVYAAASTYQTISDHTSLLLGCDYALLRNEFRPWIGWEKEIKPSASNLLVTLGGGDPDNQTKKVLQALNHIDPKLNVSIVVGAANPHVDTLKEHASRLNAEHKITFLQNVNDMPQLISAADFAISAGGTTLWEIAFLTLPNITITIADNQKLSIENLVHRNVIKSLGWFEDVTVSDIVEAIKSLSLNQKARLRMKDHARQLVDGLGVDRVVREMQELSTFKREGDISDYALVSAQLKDSDQLWKWANEASARKHFFGRAEIPWLSHAQWYQQAILSDKVRIWLLLKDNIPVAQIRYNLNDAGFAEISYSVAASARGLGIGTMILNVSKSIAAFALDVSIVKGFVMVENEPSSRAFIKAGFVRNEKNVIIKDHECLEFEWEIEDEKIYRN